MPCFTEDIIYTTHRKSAELAHSGLIDFSL